MARCRSKKSTELLKLKNSLILLRPLKTANIVTEIKPNDLKRLFIVDVMTHCQDCQWCPFQADIQDNGVWHCRLRSGGQTVRATQQEGWNGGYLVGFQMSAAVMGLAGCTMLRLAVVLKSLGWSLKDASPNPT